MPPALVDEILTLATEWADAHPEEFERVAADDFDDTIGYIVYDSFDQVLEALNTIEQDLTTDLAGDNDIGEFELQAPAQLWELVENAAKMLHVMGLQVEAAGEPIREAATAYTGRQIMRPGDRRPFFRSGNDHE
jgi:hypothetical protein